MLAMRWTRLFDDLEAQLAEQERAEWEAEVGEHTRAERGALQLADRVAGVVGLDTGVEVRLRGGARASGRVGDLGQDWLTVAGQPGAEVLVPLTAVLSVRGLTGRADPVPRRVRRLDLRHALRALARDRRPVRLVDVDGTSLHGTLQAVGRDHVDLAEHADDVPPRPGEVRQTVSVPFAALAGCWER